MTDSGSRKKWFSLEICELLCTVYGLHLLRTHTVLLIKIYAVEIGHQFRVRDIIRIGQDYISSEYEQVPTSPFGEKSKKPLFYYKKCS